MAATALSFHGVTKRYLRTDVLRGIDLDVRDGEFFGLVGVNGAGKTTLIKALLDFSTPDAGRILIHGVPSTDRRARSRLAFLPERFLPPYFLTGRDFLRTLLRLHGASFDEAALVDTLAGVDLAPEALSKPVRALSKGMAQKLGLAAVLASGKDLLVLDEPMSGLDPKARALFKRGLLARRGAGTTLFFSTHMLADVEALCDRLAVLHAGRVHFVGTPAELRERYGVDDIESAYLACVG